MRITAGVADKQHEYVRQELKATVADVLITA